MNVSVVRTQELSSTETAERAPPKPVAFSSDHLRGVRVNLEVRLGRAVMTVDEMLALKQGSIVPLETGLASLVDLYLGDTLIAQGEIVAAGDHFGVRIVEIAPVL